MAEQPAKSKGKKVLGRAWFNAIEVLDDIVNNSEDPDEQIKACKVLLEYCVSLGQSINEPFIPEKRRG